MKKNWAGFEAKCIGELHLPRSSEKYASKRFLTVDGTPGNFQQTAACLQWSLTAC